MTSQFWKTTMENYKPASVNISVRPKKIMSWSAFSVGSTKKTKGQLKNLKMN
jgi:hypothetical protein